MGTLKLAFFLFLREDCVVMKKEDVRARRCRKKVRVCLLCGVHTPGFFLLGASGFDIASHG